MDKTKHLKKNIITMACCIIVAIVLWIIALAIRNFSPHPSGVIFTLSDVAPHFCLAIIAASSLILTVNVLLKKITKSYIFYICTSVFIVAFLGEFWREAVFTSYFDKWDLLAALIGAVFTWLIGRIFLRESKE